MLACVIISIAFALLLVVTLFARKQSLARLAAAGKLDGMDEGHLLDEFGVPVRRTPFDDPETGEPREALEFEIPGQAPVRVFIDPRTRLVVGSATGPIRER
jgi:hypothetical protein